MCGIVTYFGSSGNTLTRPLTAMSAIVYRAPDSTGIGYFGDEREPVRTRKSLGPVSDLITTLIEEEAYPNPAIELIRLWNLESEQTDLVEHQRRLLAFEGFSTERLDALLQGEREYPTLDDLLDLSGHPPRGLTPGRPGRPGPLPVFVVRTRDELRELIHYLITHHDLSFLAIQTLLRNALSETLDRWRVEGRAAVQPPEVLNAFDGLFAQTFWDECKLRPGRLECELFAGSPAIETTLWSLLNDTPLQIPADYDRDGVRGVFRILDAALLCKLPHTPGLRAELQQTLETLWEGSAQHRALDWLTLYWAEKGVNVYGWAAASAFAHLHQKEILPGLLADSSTGSDPAEHLNRGQTVPHWLHYLLSPIIAQGRWALQAPVTLENAHPFADASGQRSIVLNGQFSSQVEAEIHDFLERVGGYSFRSQNSSEYFALLWGHYAKRLQEEQNRYQTIQAQVEAGLQDYTIGSQAIDYKVYQQIKDTSPSDLDEMAFLQASRRMVWDGGQMAAVGISLQSPRRMYVSGHNRPVFVVRRTDKDDFMVVSDVNAAMGLFSQSVIHRKALELGNARREYLETRERLRVSGADRETLAECEKDYQQAESSILKAFEIIVYPLEGEEVFARIEAGFDKGDFRRTVHVTDFGGNPPTEIKPFQTVLNPLRARKDLFRSFYESHLLEIPERLKDILRTYARDEKSPPRFDLRDRVLHRRFGHGLIGLKRILLVGMGSAHNAGLMARDFLQTHLPEQEILVLRPIEIEQIGDTIVPEHDLVVLLSWSSTTADMVQFAKDLDDHQAVMIGITEKRFADMALLAQKSAGVIQVLSGEEVTVAAIKSTVCMLFCIELLGLWLMSWLGRGEEALVSLEKLKRVPDMLTQILESRSAEKFSKELASRSGGSSACFIFDALESTATGHEIAKKLQESSWSAMGKCLDYRDLWIHAGRKDMYRRLILVNATHEGRLREALNVMKRLYIEGVPFAGVSFAHSQQADVHYYTRDLCLELPKLDDDLQPFMDLVLYYMFAYHYGLAHGRTAEDAPRNRSKSVTAARSRPKHVPYQATELQILKEKASQSAPEAVPPRQTLSRETVWEQGAAFEIEKRYYHEMRRMAEMFSRKDVNTLLQLSSESLTELTKAVFVDLPEEGEIVFVSLDRGAHAAAKNLVARWGRFLEYFLRVSPGGESLSHFREDAVLIFIGTKPPESRVLSGLLQDVFVPCLWVGPEIPENAARFFTASLGCCTLNNLFGCTGNDLLYAGLSYLLLAAWREKRPEKARIVEQHFEQISRVVEAVLNDASLREAVFDAMAADRFYPSAYFSGPPGGTGLAWVDRFDQVGSLTLEHHFYGEGAHGPLVNVDPRVDRKFIPLRSGSEMVSRYGKERVAEWERRYLGKESMDAFLKRQRADLYSQIERPFFAEGQWFLPVLRPDYDAAEDILVIIDATSERHFDHALDELATYGVRYARMMVITQRAFLGAEQRDALGSQPVSHLLLLPSLEGNGGGEVPIPELLLPFAMNLLSMRLSAAAAQIRSRPFEPLSQESVFRQNFGPLGELMIRHRMDLDYLNPRLIDSLRDLAPVVAAIEGTGRYAVKEVHDESQLRRLADDQHLYNPDKTIGHFRAQRAHATPFFLVRADHRVFEGRVLELASKTFHKDEWDLWHEAYGDTWSVLQGRTPGIREIGQTESLLMLPFVGRSWDDGGWLYHMCPRYVEWDHAGGLEEQLRITTNALEGESTVEGLLSARYREIVGLFNAGLAAQGHVWDDRLLTLAKRPLLFCKTSRSTVELLLERVQTLLDLLRQRNKTASVEEIAEGLRRAWPALLGKETLNDVERWDVLQEIVIDTLEAGK